MQVDTRLGEAAPSPAAHAYVLLLYLQSWVGMGTARLACESGCKCLDNAHLDVDGYRNVSRLLAHERAF